MLGNSNKEYLEKIVSLKRQLPQTENDEEKIEIHETIYNCYVRMGLLLEAEGALFDYIEMLRRTRPKNNVILTELLLAKLIIDNGKIELGIDQMNYGLALCTYDDVEDKEAYLTTLMQIYYALSLRDTKFRPQYDQYLKKYEDEIKPTTVLDKLNYYFSLSGAYFSDKNQKKGYNQNN